MSGCTRHGLGASVSDPKVAFHACAWGSDHLLAALNGVARAGFEGIEVYSDVSHVFVDRPHEFLDICSISGMRLSGIHSGGALTTPEFHEAELLEWRRLLSWAHAAGADYCVYYGGVRTAEFDADLDAAASLLRQLGESAGDVGIRLLYEPDSTCPFDSPEALDGLMSRLDPSHVGLSVDTARVAQMGFEPTFFMLTHSERLEVVHVRDLRPESDERWARNPYVEPGRGTLDLHGIADTLRMTGFDGWVVGVVEHPDTAAVTSAMSVAEYFRSRLDFTF